MFATAEKSGVKGGKGVGGLSLLLGLRRADVEKISLGVSHCFRPAKRVDGEGRLAELGGVDGKESAQAGRGRFLG